MISQDVSSPCWHADFVKMLPTIELQARISFRHLKGDTRDEAIQETVCNACQAYSRLVGQGRADAANPSSLAIFAVRQVRDGRRVGSELNVNDICSTHCRRRKGVAVQNLNQWSSEDHEWREILVEDRHANPADLAASRIDFPAFLKSLSPQKRRIAEKLATGESTGRVAKIFGVSAGRISQLRQELKTAWEQFHQPVSPETELAVA